jgi:hypothetical protein
MNKFLSRLADTLLVLFPVNQATYIEEWDVHSEINAYDRFIWNLLTEDLWNIDFDYYDRLMLADRHHLKLLGMEEFYGEEMIIL